jgi:hypothetical protein
MMDTTILINLVLTVVGLLIGYMAGWYVPDDSGHTVYVVPRKHWRRGEDDVS